MNNFWILFLCQQCQGLPARTPGGPANQSGLPGGSGRVGDLDKIAKNANEPWGDLNERERAKVMSNMKDRFPERYRELLEQYYRGLLQEGEE